MKKHRIKYWVQSNTGTKPLWWGKGNWCQKPDYNCQSVAICYTMKQASKIAGKR